MSFFVAVAPIVFLVYLMTKRNATPSHIALPVVAAIIYFLSLVYFGTDANLVNATVVKGILTALTPILIIWGAIFMFKTMESSGGMDVVRGWLNGISANPVAQLMIIGWAFSFLIEGASGFGTPAALAAPILVGLGFPAVRVAILCLVMNSVPVSFGAVGTPTWFGLGQLGLSEAEMVRVGAQTALIHSFASLIIPVIALLFVLDWKTIRSNLVFVYISVLSCVVPYLLLALVNYEFPSLLGGMIGTLASILFARNGIGLAGSRDKEHRPGSEPANSIETQIAPSARPPLIDRSVIKATFPIWGAVAILVVTRIEQLGLQGFLTDATPIVEASLGSLGSFGTSASLVLRLDNIFGSESAWSLQALYIPAFVPFFVVSAITFLIYRVPSQTVIDIARDSYQRMRAPIFALMGALTMVQLLMVGGADSIVVLIGRTFADTAGGSWIYVASLLGAIGAFFSGSNTVSNLTFGGIQESIALALGLDRTLVLALQSVGGAMGNMVCINNIVAVCTVLGINNQEGYILKRTFLPMMVYALVAAAIGAVL